jgi:hypothetical protein
MLDAARSYVMDTLPRLPNFLATRTINRFDDSRQVVKKGEWPQRAGLHPVDTSSREISVSNEREDQPPTQGSAVWKEQIGLISGGEFGTTLGMILSDSARGTVTWSHWERIAAGTAAVFHYAVPKSASHFELIGALERQAALAGVATRTGGSRGTAGIGVQPSGVSTTNTSVLVVKPGYHGAIWLDPATGIIHRITMQADTKDDPLFKRAEMMVQYGPVQIGDRKYICPVRSVALSVASTGGQSVSEDAPRMWLNETLFTGYHRFIATTRILPDEPAPQ